MDDDGFEVVEGGGDGKTEWKEVVKIYCWEEVCREVWLLMFVDSRKWVRDVGGRFLDAGGEVVLDMK